jgi:hypothetical protein
MAHKIGWSCFPKINGAELKSLGAPNMEVPISDCHLSLFFFCFFFVILHHAFTLSFVVSFLPFF